MSDTDIAEKHGLLHPGQTRWATSASWDEQVLSAIAEARADERERCAKVCENQPCDCCWHEDAKTMADECACAIRALTPEAAKEMKK